MIYIHASMFHYLMCEVMCGNFNLVAIQKKSQFYDLYNLNTRYSYSILWFVIPNVL